MTVLRKTSVYTLTAPRENLLEAGFTLARAERKANAAEVEIAGSYVRKPCTVVFRFRIGSDLKAIALADEIVGHDMPAELHTGVGVNHRLVAENR